MIDSAAILFPPDQNASIFWRRSATPAFAQPKDCDELKAEIDAKITVNGVGSFTTTIVDKDAAEDGQVVGTCEAGSKKIVYKRG